MKVYRPRDTKARLYFRKIYPYVSFFREILFGFFSVLAHLPARIVEIFLRRNFGERYYSLDAPVIMFLAMSYPLYIWISTGSYEFIQMMGFSWFWILFSFVFLGFAIKRKREINHDLQSFDDAKYSMYSGDEWSIWYRFENKLPRLFKRDTFFYNIERVYEGGLFLIVGFVFLFIPFSRYVGVLLIFSGASYMFTMYLRYLKSRDMVLDQIDDKIHNEDMHDAFTNDKSKRGFRWFGPKPDDPQFRETIAESLVDEEGDFSVVS